jgi:serine/threonine protein phosphatase PrpC
MWRDPEDFEREDGLAMSRSVGDRNGEPYISHEPDVFQFDPGHEPVVVRFVVASDGLWDVVANDQLSNLDAIELVSMAVSNRSGDNITAVVAIVRFPQEEEEEEDDDDFKVVVKGIETEREGKRYFS